MKTKEVEISYHAGMITMKIKIFVCENYLVPIIDSVVKTLILDGNIITEIHMKHEIKE